MFWNGMIVGIFVGAAMGILVMALVISASSNDDAEVDSYLDDSTLFEAGEELVPDEEKED